MKIFLNLCLIIRQENVTGIQQILQKHRVLQILIEANTLLNVQDTG